MKKQFIILSTATALLAACGEAPRTPVSPDATTQKQAAETTNTTTPLATENTPQSASAPHPSMVAAVASMVAAQPIVATPATPEMASAPALASAPTAITTHNLPAHRPFVITADLEFRTTDVRQTAVAIEQLASKHGGFVIHNQTSSHIVSSRKFEQSDGLLLFIDNYLSRADLTVRVPRQNAQAFLHDVQPYITLLENQKFAAEDVTASLQRQILAAQREQQRNKDLQQLNWQSKAAQHDRRATIEAQYQAREMEDEAKIQQTELQDKIQFATINLHFRQPEQIIKHTTPNPTAVAQAHRPSFWASVGVALASSWQMILSIILFIFEIWYVIVGALLLLWWQRKRANRVVEQHDFEVEELPDDEDEDIEDDDEDDNPPPIRRRKNRYSR